MGGYGLGRFIIEGLRSDSLMIGSTGIKVSQALALVCFIAAVILLVINYVKCAKNGWPAVEISGTDDQHVETSGTESRSVETDSAKEQSVEDSGAESQPVEAGGTETLKAHEKNRENK